MKKGFTLLELIIVIIILGVLATLGFTQYGRMVERARGAEARQILGDIRKFAAAYALERGNLTGITNTTVNIGTLNDQIPGPAAANCRTSHYFAYGLTAVSPTSFTATATRCAAGGKTPNYTAGGGVQQLNLTSNISSGVDNWTSNGGY